MPIVLNFLFYNKYKLMIKGTKQNCLRVYLLKVNCLCSCFVTLLILCVYLFSYSLTYSTEIRVSVKRNI